jgi:hypothetical protein
MLRHAAAGIVMLVILAGSATAADKEVVATVVKADLKNSTLTVKTADGNKVYDINDQTRFLGPKGGVSDAGLKDDRLVAGADVKLLIAGNNKTAREVHLPLRTKGKEK